ncbi:MAG: VWA domain-containing protein [Sandaracinaceae bacterium]|nr:VWA domain-containing protein [Sandaracinaceae bacterium]MBK7153839.1 VWA domain-containing protein [Sandaracinaceae bacterium]MBK7775336.1 VWA domain-containing protein [Sandaracinaceae bacterium]MBK8408196.1 VWA domain-containing protein [Sandaracinaceae bacterium]MBK8591023.1 VWA domain-containing protein [Sandaracinaceae bacterium]
MFVDFIYELRAFGVPVGATETVRLAEAMSKGLHENSLDGFYYVARAVLVHSERHLDLFDQAFLKHFKGIEVESKKLTDDLLDWLKKAKDQMGELTEEQRKFVEGLDLEELKKLFDERMKEQDERHDGGNKWIGTAGTSPFGHSGKSPQGIRVGGPGGGRSAVKVADARLYKGYREDVTLDVRQMQLALRKLRTYTRIGAEEELDLEATIEETGKNAGELEIVTRPPRRTNTRIILMMDVGGSMDPYAHLCSRLFSAAKKSSHFRELQTYYFHNCVYGQVYKTERFDEPVKVRDLLNDCGRHYKLILVGDALMAAYELMATGGSLDLGDDRGIEGIQWLMMLQKHFDKSIWLNPEPEKYWKGNTIEYVARVFDMYPLTLEGLGEGVKYLMRGQARGSK